LGNTPAVCRKCYVHPEVIAAFMEEGTLGLGALGASGSRGLSGDERVVVAFLRKRSRETPKQRTRRQLRKSLSR
jgi:DNA topoisomerase I